MDTEWGLERLYHTIINARDLDETLAFYNLLGFRVVHDRRDVKWPDFVGEMFGMTKAAGRGVLVNLPSDPTGPMLDIVQWVEGNPQLPERVDGSVVPRVIAFRVRNLAAAVASLRQQGVSFTTDIVRPSGGSNVTGVCCCRDPNGTIIELIELRPGARHSLDTSANSAG